MESVEPSRVEERYTVCASTSGAYAEVDDEYRAFDADSSLSPFAFIAIWDPEDQTIVFSPTENFDASNANSLSPMHPHCPKPSISDIQSLLLPGAASSSSSISRYSDCYQTLRDRHDTLFSVYAKEEKQPRIRGMSQTSSTLGGLDVYLKGAALAHTHRHQPVYSVLDFETGFDLKAHSHTQGANENPMGGGYFGRLSRLNLCTTPDNKPTESKDDKWVAVESLTSEELLEEGSKKFSGGLMKSRSGRRLKKRRPSECKASPTSSTAATPWGTNETIVQATKSDASPSINVSLGLTPKYLWRFGKWKRRSEDEWIMVDL